MDALAGRDNRWRCAPRMAPPRPGSLFAAGPAPMVRGVDVARPGPRRRAAAGGRTHPAQESGHLRPGRGDRRGARDLARGGAAHRGDRRSTTALRPALQPDCRSLPPRALCGGGGSSGRGAGGGGQARQRSRPDPGSVADRPDRGRPRPPPRGPRRARTGSRRVHRASHGLRRGPGLARARRSLFGARANRRGARPGLRDGLDLQGARRAPRGTGGPRPVLPRRQGGRALARAGAPARLLPGPRSTRQGTPLRGPCMKHGAEPPVIHSRSPRDNPRLASPDVATAIRIEDAAHVRPGTAASTLRVARIEDAAGGVQGCTKPLPYSSWICPGWDCCSLSRLAISLGRSRRTEHVSRVEKSGEGQADQGVARKRAWHLRLLSSRAPRRRPELAVRWKGTSRESVALASVKKYTLSAIYGALAREDGALGLGP